MIKAEDLKVFDSIDDAVNAINEAFDNIETKPVGDVIRRYMSLYHSLSKLKAKLYYVSDKIDAEYEYNKNVAFKAFVDKNNKALPGRDIMAVVEASSELKEIRDAKLEVSYYKTLLDSTLKSMEACNWQLNNLTKLIINQLETYHI